MREELVLRWKLQFELNRKSFYSFGEDLVDAGSPNPCSRSSAARQVLHGRWQKAYQMWLDEGEYSRCAGEEMYVGWILSSEVIVNKGRPLPIPTLPKRIWDVPSYDKALRRYEDVKFRNQTIASLLEPGTTAWKKERNAIGKLVQENKWEEAEALYNHYEWRQNSLAESWLALIHSCVTAQPENLNQTSMWYYCEPGRDVSCPVKYEKLRDLFIECRLTSRCMVWREGMEEWAPAISLKTFKSVVFAGPLPPPLPPAS